MLAMILEQPGQPLRAANLALPAPGAGQVLIQVHACAVCRTDLHVVDGELPDPKLPLIPGHEIVGAVVENGAGADRFVPGDRVGVPWLGWTCGECRFCRSGSENLCERGRFTGYTLDGGYAEYAVADERFCCPIPAGYSDAEAAPLLCAGMIGYRSLAKTGAAKRIGLYGFGAAAHIVTHARSSPSLALAMMKRNASPVHWAQRGPAIAMRYRQRSWRRRLFSHPSGVWFRSP
jgi:alcohol dehydrogenase, propanol-preferring